MAPWLHDLLGYPNSGRWFELVFWSLAVLVGAALLFRERRSGRELRDNVLAWLVGVGLVVFGATRWVFALAGQLYFGEHGLDVPTYGVAMALGFGVPLALGVRDARRHPGALTGAQAVDLTFWVIVAGLVGARVLAIITDLPDTLGPCLSPEPGSARDCAPLFSFWRGGVVFYGGLIGALGAGWWWCRRQGVAFLPAADQFVPFLALGHAIGRLGCVAAGCCFGAECPTEYPLGLAFPAGSPVWAAQLAAHGGVPTTLMAETLRAAPVHPTQLYEVAVEAGLFAVLLRRRRRGVAPGANLGAWLCTYGAARFVLEVFRGDVIRGFVFRIELPSVTRLLGLSADTPLLLSTSQAVALAAVALGAVLWRQARSSAR